MSASPFSSFRKGFAILGVEPEHLVTLEFDHRSRTVIVRSGGPDLFETMQEASALDEGQDAEQAE